MGADNTSDLREALKTVAVALKQTGLPFALMGGYAAWARGGPEPDHDVDFLVADEDSVEVAARLADQDLDVVQPPEDVCRIAWSPASVTVGARRRPTGRRDA